MGREEAPAGGESADLQTAAVAEAEDNAAWWTEEWLKFPTISLDGDGGWHYWDVPEDSGIYSDDWRTGESLARDTVSQMQAFQSGSSALRRILSEIDFDSTVGQGFITRIEDMLTNPGVYLDSLEPGSVQAKLRGN